jgi:hypothetical protein
VVIGARRCRTAIAYHDSKRSAISLELEDGDEADDVVDEDLELYED